MKKVDEFKKFKNISIIQYPGAKLCHSKGKIIKIMNNFEFSHSASTEPGSWGSPIF